MSTRISHDTEIFARAIVVFTFLFAAAGVAMGDDTSSQASKEAARGQSRYEVVTKGLLANPTFPLQYRSAALRLEIRDLIMGPGEAQGVPTPARTLMELRGGGVTTIVNGEKQERRPGDFWTIDKGSSLTLQNEGDVAVIRVIQFNQEPR